MKFKLFRWLDYFKIKRKQSLMNTRIRFTDPKAKDPKYATKEEVICGDPGAVKTLYESMGYSVEVLGTESGEEMIIGPGGNPIPKSQMDKIINEANKEKMAQLHRDANLRPLRAGTKEDAENPKPIVPKQPAPPVQEGPKERPPFQPVQVNEPVYIFFEEAGIKFRVNPATKIVEKLSLTQIKEENLDEYSVQIGKNAKLIPLRDAKAVLYRKEWITVTK